MPPHAPSARAPVAETRSLSWSPHLQGDWGEVGHVKALTSSDICGRPNVPRTTRTSSRWDRIPHETRLQSCKSNKINTDQYSKSNLPFLENWPSGKVSLFHPEIQSLQSPIVFKILALRNPVNLRPRAWSTRVSTNTSPRILASPTVTAPRAKLWIKMWKAWAKLVILVHVWNGTGNLCHASGRGLA